MGDNDGLTRAQHAVLLWAFLQADCEESPDFCKEVQSLSKDFNDNEAAHYTVDSENLETDEYLETDGHVSSNLSILLEGIGPSADADVPVVIQQVAEEIRGIAAQFEHNLVTRATRNLTRNISGSSTEQWKEHLHQEVQHILAHGMGLNNLHRERVIVALTFTLVKGVCLQAPRLLRSLFSTALQYLCPE